jgi:hypothetical protein
MWQIVGNLGPYARSGFDAGGWLWEIEREDVAKRVLVEITGTALAVSREYLPDETRAAIETEGQSEVDKVLAANEPPRVIVCGTMGCRALTADEVAAG